MVRTRSEQGQPWRNRTKVSRLVFATGSLGSGRHRRMEAIFQLGGVADGNARYSKTPAIWGLRPYGLFEP